MPPAARTRRATQRDVAQRAGVSQAVVSQVLNDRRGAIRVNAETRERVLDAMRDLGYVPNAAAQRLASGRNRILGVFTFEPVFPSSSRDFYYPFLEGIERACAELDHDLLLHTRPSSDPTRRRVYSRGSSRLQLTDGTLMLGALDEHDRADVERLLDDGHPLVFIGRRELQHHAPLYAAADYARVTREAYAALRAAGSARVAYLGETNDHESALDRERGYRDACASDGRDAVVLRDDHFTPATLEQLRAAGVRGVLFENDLVAHQALPGAARAPVAFAVLGDPLGTAEFPAHWAHFRIPRLEMGHEAVRLLVASLNGESVSPVTLPCAWVPAPSLRAP